MFIRRLGPTLSIIFAVLISSSGWLAAVAADAPAKMSELEKYVRIQIEIGSAMKEFFKDMGPPTGPPSEEQQAAMVEQIDQTVATILKKYGLTTDEYNRRKKDVFKDEAAVNAFLERHPDLKAQWEAQPFRGPGGHGRQPPSTGY